MGWRLPGGAPGVCSSGHLCSDHCLSAPALPPSPPGKAGGPGCPRSRVGGSTHTSPQGVADGGVAPCPQGLGTNLPGMKRAGGGKRGGGKLREQQEEGGGGREMGTGTIPGQWVRSRDGERGGSCHSLGHSWHSHAGQDPRTQGGSAGSSQDLGRAAGPGAASLHPPLPFHCGDTAPGPPRGSPCPPAAPQAVPLCLIR